MSRRTPRQRAGIGLAAAASLVLASCGAGTAAIAKLLKSGGSSAARPGAIVISDVDAGSALDRKQSPATLSFRLTDGAARPLSVEILVVHPGGATEPALLVGNTDLTALATSPAGVDHQRQWDFAAQLPSGTALSSGLRIMVRRAGDASGPTTGPFDVGNDPPTVAVLSSPSDEVEGPVAIDLSLADSSADLADVVVEYADQADPSNWKPATPLGSDLQQVATSPSGMHALFLWDVEADAPQREFRARLRFTPSDAFDAGVVVETPDLQLDNNAPPTLLVDGSGFFADPDSRRAIPVRYQLIDAEGDAVRVVFQWGPDASSFPALPASPAALDAILADPDLRHQHRIATEAPLLHYGWLLPIDGVTAQLHELGSSAAGLLSEYVAGRSLELLAVPSPPAGRAAGWASDPLAGPVAALSVGDGHDGLVLDRPSSGQWRLREIDLATGVVVRDLASGADGDPSALAYGSEERSVLVAADVAGAWTVFEIALADGARTPFFAGTGAFATGTVRGLVATGKDTLLLTVGNALIAVDRAFPGGATGRTVLNGLAGPWGIAVDPRHPSQLYLAEATWVDPATSTVEGRVSIVDLGTLTRSDLVSTGLKLARPEAIALERGGARLLAVVDANTADSTRELRCVDLGTGGGGPAFQVVAGLPLDVAGLATGSDDQRLLALPAANDVAVGGGVQQVRTISAVDVATRRVTVAAPFVPPLDARQAWRIRDDSSPRPAGASVRGDTFVWDSSDLPAGGSVVLRGTAYDTEPGLATDTGVPRPVRAGLDVLPVHIGGVASTTSVASLEAADLDGDGDLDVVSANQGADSVTIFFQDKSHKFPTAPSVTLIGIPLLARMTQPVSVVAADLDKDGDTDLATASHASNNLTIAKQNSPGSFTVQGFSLGGITGPTCVVAADLNGDRRIDLACSCDGSNNVAIYVQSMLGSFPTNPTLLLSSVNTLAPSGLDAGDFDGDGDVDLVASLRGKNQIAIWLQAGGGSFPTAPSQLIGGAGLTDGPAAVRLFDVDRDGRLDVVNANQAGNCVTVFLQATAGGVGVFPTFTLASSAGPIAPRHVAVGDVNGDGGIDIVAPSANDSLATFLRDPAAGTFNSEPLVVHGAGGIVGPVHVVLDDLDADGQIDLASANQGGNDLTLFFQLGGRSFTGQSPDLVLGSAIDTPDVHGVAVADLDGDGDLDLATANTGDGTISLFPQLAPAVFGSQVGQRLGGGASTAGTNAVVAADWNGDGRVDLVAANRTGKTVTGFAHQGDGTFAAAASFTLGAGALGDPFHLACADLDGDGDLDLAVADASANRVQLFHRNAGAYPAAPDATLGSNATTKSPVFVLAADLDGDGASDLACANSAGNNVTVFFQQPGGTFNALPDATLGSNGTTNGPVVVAAADLDGDGDVDLACANLNSNSVTLFLASAQGVFPTTPSLTLTHASLLAPTCLSLEDVDRDGSPDVVAGGSSSDAFVLFFQSNPGVFTTVEVVGATAFTSSPQSLRVVDVDGDGDSDLVSAQPDLDNVPIFFGAH